MFRFFFITFLLTLAYALPGYSSTQIIMFGDSLVSGYHLAPNESLPAQLEAELIKTGLDVKVINAGLSGDTTYGGITRLNPVINENPRVVIIVLGANDMLRGIDPEKTYENLDQIITSLKNKKIRVMLSAMKSSSNFGIVFQTKFDAIYPQLSKKHSATLIPFILEKIINDPSKMLTDGVHPNSLGVSQIVQEIMPVVIKELKEVN